MPEWIVTVFGESFAPIVWVVIVAAMVCLLAVVLLVIARKLFGNGSLPASFKSRAPRLAVLDMTRIDEKRRLVLVRRDEVEHLILVGGQTDIVVEPGILRLPASNLEQFDARKDEHVGLDRRHKSVLQDFNRGLRDPVEKRGERATRATESDQPSVAPRIEPVSPIASPSPALPEAAEPRQAPQRPTVGDRRNSSAAEPSAAEGHEAGAENEPSSPYGDRPAARLANSAGNATAALAAAMPGLMRSRSAEAFETSREETDEAVVRVGVPRSLATPTLPTPPETVASSTFQAAPTSPLAPRSEVRALRVSLEKRSSPSSLPASAERFTSLSPSRDRTERMIALEPMEDTFGADAPLVSAVAGDRRSLSTLPTASALGEARLAAASATAGESASAWIGRRRVFGAPASGGAQDAGRPTNSAGENGETDSPRMPLSVKSFATAIQNRKAPQSLETAGRTPTQNTATRSPSGGNSTPDGDPAAESPPASPVSDGKTREADSGSAPASQPSSGPTEDTPVRAEGSRASRPAQEEATQTAAASPELTGAPPAENHGIEVGELEDFLSAELGSGFDHTDETAESFTFSQSSRADVAGDPDRLAEHIRSGPAPVPVPVPAPDDSARRTDRRTGTERASQVAASTSNPSIEADSSETPVDPSPIKSIPMENRSTSADTPTSETEGTAVRLSAPTVSLGPTGEPDAAPRVEMTETSRLGAASTVLDGSGREESGTSAPDARPPMPSQPTSAESARPAGFESIYRLDKGVSVSSEVSSNQKPDVTSKMATSSYAMRLNSARPPRSAEPARPKLSLEEEMERLLGDFSFDEPQARDR